MAFGEKKNFFGKLTERLGDLLTARPTPDEDMLDEMEEILITSDIGMDTTEKIIERLRAAIREDRIQDANGVKEALANIICELLDKGDRQSLNCNYPLIILVIGVNGVGKTTSIAKLAY